MERRELHPTVRRPFQGNSLPFPGRPTESIGFADASGRALLRMSARVQPRDAVRRLFNLCAARTGLVEQFRCTEVPDF